MKNRNTFALVLAAIFAGISAVLSQIQIPLGLVPINMTHISIFLAAGLLGFKCGTASQALYVVLGAIGMPVFTGFTSGLGIMSGPTGGFIIGYIACTAATAVLIDHFGRTIVSIALAMTVGMAVSYICGVAWYMYSMHVTLIPALTTCVFPFLPGDALKIALSAALVKRLRPVIKSQFVWEN